MMSTTTCPSPLLDNAPPAAGLAAVVGAAVALAAGACALLAADGCGEATGVFVPAAVYVGNAGAGARLSDTTAAGVCAVGLGAAVLEAGAFASVGFAAVAAVRLAITGFCVILRSVMLMRAHSTSCSRGALA